MDLDVQSYSLGHLGIVAGIFDTLKIGEVIDEVMPKQGSKNLPHSTIIKAYPSSKITNKVWPFYRYLGHLTIE